MNFENLPKASSLAVVCMTQFDKEAVLAAFYDILKKKVGLYKTNVALMWTDYSDRLYKKGIPMPFSDQNQRNFMGIIQGVSLGGALQVLLEDDAIAEFDIKEIQMLY